MRLFRVSATLDALRLAAGHLESDAMWAAVFTLQSPFVKAWRRPRTRRRAFDSARGAVRSGLVCLYLGASLACAAEGEAPTPAEVSAARAKSGEESVKAWRALAERYPRSGTVWFELGDALYGAQEYEPALVAYEKSGQLGEKPAAFETRAGKCLAKLKRYPQAEAAYRRALRAAPDSVSAKFGLASALYSQEKSAAALPLFEELAARPDEWGETAAEFLASCCYDTGQYERALGLLRPLLAKRPEDAGLRWTYARSLYKAKEYEDALEQFERAAKMNPAKAEAAAYYRAACLQGMGRSREAEAAYDKLAEGQSEWAKEARAAAQSLAGKPYRITLDFLTGYDTGIVQSDDNGTFSGGRDAFTQQFASLEGRVYRGERLNIWLAGQHFGLHYPELHDNDYFEDAASVTFNFPKVGIFSNVALKYQFKYAWLDYQSYLKENEVEVRATYEQGPDKFTFGANIGDNKYFRSARGLDGPDVRFFVDYKRRLPLWEHELRLRANVDYRWSQAPVSQRFSQRARLMYRAKIWRDLYGQLEATYRRDDFPNSQSDSLRQRTDHRLSGEVRFEYELWKHFSFNWGYKYESQDSRVESQEYGHHQADGGFTFSF